MMTNRGGRAPAPRFWKLGGLLGFALVAASCASNGGGYDATDEPSGRERRAQSSGVYKVGEPYQVGGVWYYPREDTNYDQTGVASWYGQEFGGRPTANGEIFDPGLVTAAHTTLPMPSLVRVTNLENGASIVARVNDRGPFKRGRIIDMSEAAAVRLGFREAGVAKVRVQYAGRAPVGGLGPERIAAVETPASARETRAAPVGSVEGGRLDDAPPTYRAPQSVTPPVSTRRNAAAGGDLWIQVGAFLERGNADRLRAELAAGLPTRVVQADIDGRRFYRVRVGPYTRVEDADTALDAVFARGHAGARLIVE